MSLLDLPVEVLQDILPHLDHSSLAKLSVTCKAMKTLTFPLLYEQIRPANLRGCRQLFQQASRGRTSSEVTEAFKYTTAVIIPRFDGSHLDITDVANGLTVCILEQLSPSSENTAMALCVLGG